MLQVSRLRDVLSIEATNATVAIRDTQRLRARPTVQGQTLAYKG